MIQQALGNHAANVSRSEPGLSPDILDAQGPVKLSGISTPVTLKLSQDVKIVYQTIGKLAGVNVLFDPDFAARQVNIELNGVTLQEALDLVAAESKTFWKPMTRNTIFVAADNPAKRKELEENVIKAFYLSNLSAPDRTPGSGEHTAFRPRRDSSSASRFSGSNRDSGNARPGSPGRKDGERL